MKVTRWKIEEITGYKPKTTFYEDFSIAENFGLKDVYETYKSARRMAKEFGLIYIAELAMVLNWKIAEHYRKDSRLASIYNDMFCVFMQWVKENLQGEELKRFYEIID